MSFTYTRTIYFQDTDAAGVVYFANVLAICHEAYEESLAASSINLKLFFSNQDVAIPIVHASIDFIKPLFCGDKILIHLSPKYLTEHSFEIAYNIILAQTEKLVATAITKHVCIDKMSRSRKEIPGEIKQWLHHWSDAVAM
ncbi:1,4-dihydroxy-2-naphthoyl-CoA hydrolase [Crinalium epipsammum PCC 9333]|uniref:1,4-dihydroxy-2-naphthoyl-CoA hydrolase n=1 Tax=Crinalium epipsammum PCC 9333 TaxID=1173022 RepID=K9W5E5_9CYAN|nr:thioesterase family protein [Crinalium epipsammum]AFZ14680.1 1,4-dihydroxy-2-naphthoyl-CoA hydrolase [Crinalium epipsammum PCC 9333]